MPLSVEAGVGRDHAPTKADLSSRYWNVNLPPEAWTEECPEYLLAQSEKNIGILSQRDSDLPRFSWQHVQDLVKTNRLNHFQRSSSGLRLYLEYIHQLKTQYGSVLSYIQHERLRWETLTPSGDVPFSNPTDFKILYNDWPYYIDKDITHLVVWTKFPIDEVEATGEVTRDAKAAIDAFVARKFCSAESGPDLTMDRQQIRWFKNWKSLKSVHALEHFHIMLYKAPAALVDAVTEGDRPRSESWVVMKQVV